MFNNFYAILLFLSFRIQRSFADYSSNVWSQSQDGVEAGATIVLSEGALTETGFRATVYSFPYASFWNFGYIGASYTTNGIKAFTNSIREPNFSMGTFNHALSFSAGYDFYGFSNIPMLDTLVELKGYYARK